MDNWIKQDTSFMPENVLIEKYEDKLQQLNQLLDQEMITFDEYGEMVKDFRNVEAIRDDIVDENLKCFASIIVQNCKPLIQTYK